MMKSHEAPTYKVGKNKSVAPTGVMSPDDARAAAMQFLGGLAAEVSSGTVDLPCFPDVVLRIRKTLSDPKNTPEKTVTVVSAEPQLAARLLQTANSAAFNPSGKPLTDLRTAITRLGHQMVQSAAMSFAVQHMKNEASLRSIAGRMNELWKESISVAMICQTVARRTKVTPDEAFLTGLMHGIGRLYIMVRAVEKGEEFGMSAAFRELIDGWHASIGKAVLETWGFPEELCEAVAVQSETDLRNKEPNLSDVLVASIVLGETLRKPVPRVVKTEGIHSFETIGLSEKDNADILTHTEYQLGCLQEALG